MPDPYATPQQISRLIRESGKVKAILASLHDVLADTPGNRQVSVVSLREIIRRYGGTQPPRRRYYKPPDAPPLDSIGKPAKPVVAAALQQQAHTDDVAEYQRRQSRKVKLTPYD